jgi:hypothetical protein
VRPRPGKAFARRLTGAIRVDDCRRDELGPGDASRSAGSAGGACARARPAHADGSFLDHYLGDGSIDDLLAAGDAPGVARFTADP